MLWKREQAELEAERVQEPEQEEQPGPEPVGAEQMAEGAEERDVEREAEEPLPEGVEVQRFQLICLTRRSTRSSVIVRCALISISVYLRA